MTNEQFHTLRIGNHVRARSGKVYAVIALRTLQVSAVQIRDGKGHGPTRMLKASSIELVPVVDAQHPTNAALTAMLQPPAKPPTRKVLEGRVATVGAGLARIATAWQRNYPCPPMTDEPELHALWMNVERMLAHANGQR